MRTKRKSYEHQSTLPEGPKIQTLDFRLAIAEYGLEDTVKRSFVLAKSAGRELDVLFCSEPHLGNSAPRFPVRISPAGISN